MLSQNEYLTTILTIAFSSFVLGCFAVTIIAQKYPPKWCTKVPISIELPSTFHIAEV